MIRSIEGAGGVPIAVEDPGGDAAPVVFVHGFAHQRQVWDDVLAALRCPCRAIRFDLRGHGASGWSPSGAYAVHDYAADLPRVLDALGLPRAAIVAHSLGGNAATLAAAAHPDRVAALVLVDTGPSLSPTGMLQVADGVAGALRSWSRLADYRATLDVTYPLADGAVLDRLAEHGVVTRLDGRIEPRLDPAALGGDVAPGVLEALEADLWRAVERLAAPLLIVRGAASAMLPEAVARRMLEAAGGPATLETIERAGHSVMLDAPAALAARLDAFLEGPLDALVAALRDARPAAPGADAQAPDDARWPRTASSQAALASS